MGARADGWWRDRAAAALRLCREVMALAGRDDSPADAWVLVLEGRAREAANSLNDEALPAPGARPGTDWMPETVPDVADEAPAEASPVRVVSAPGSGDDAIVGV